MMALVWQKYGLMIRESAAQICILLGGSLTICGKQFGSVSIFNNLVMFAGVFLITLFCLAGMEQLIVNLRKSIGIKKGVAFFYWILCCLICYFLLF